MADGKTHFNAALATNAVLVGAGIWAISEGAPDAAINGMITGAAIGTVITPDFDLVGTTYTEKAIRSIPIIGGVVGVILQTTWYPYALLSKHRGLSHTHLLGTLTRFAYLLCALVVWTWLINGAMLSLDIALEVKHYAATIIEFCVNNPAFSIAMLLAWTLHDEAHLLLDGGKTKTKKTKTTKGKTGPWTGEIVWASAHTLWTKRSPICACVSAGAERLFKFGSAAGEITASLFRAAFLCASAGTRSLSNLYNRWTRFNSSTLTPNTSRL